MLYSQCAVLWGRGGGGFDKGWQIFVEPPMSNVVFEGEFQAHTTRPEEGCHNFGPESTQNAPTRSQAGHREEHA